jgi:hypothetical protein
MKRLAILSVLAGCALIAACGDDEEADDTSSTTGDPGTSSTGGPGGSSSSTGAGAAGGSGAAGGAGGSGATGGLPDGDWACVGNVDWPAPAAAMVTITANAQTLQGGDPLPNLSVTACAKADTACASPITTGTTDAQGNITLTLPAGAAGFDGFFEVTGASIPDALVFVNPPIAADMNDLNVPLIDNDTLGLLDLTGIDLDPTRGHVAAIGLDCALVEGQGLSVSSSTADAESTQIYVVGGLPNVNATETDESGATGIFNIPPGASSLTAVIASTGDTTGTVEVQIRAGTISYATLPPTP